MNRLMLIFTTLCFAALVLCFAAQAPACPPQGCGVGGNQTFAFVQAAPFVGYSHYGAAVQVQAFNTFAVPYVQQRVFVQSHAVAAPQVNVQVNQVNQRVRLFPRLAPTRVRVLVR